MDTTATTTSGKLRTESTKKVRLKTSGKVRLEPFLLWFDLGSSDRATSGVESCRF